MMFRPDSRAMRASAFGSRPMPIGRVDYRFSAKGAIFSQLVNRNVDIKQLTVIAAHQRVERQFAKVFHFHRHFGKMAIAAAAGRHPFAGGIQQNMLMHQSNAHFVNRQWAKHSHYITAANANRQREGWRKLNLSSAILAAERVGLRMRVFSQIASRIMVPVAIWV